MVLVSAADHAQHVKERAQDDMGEQCATKQFMERHDNVTNKTAAAPTSTCAKSAGSA